MIDDAEYRPAVTAHEVFLPGEGTMGGAENGSKTESKSREGVSEQNSVPSADPYAVTDAMRDEATAGVDREIAAYRDYMDRLKLESDDERRKRERRERSKRIIGAVSDGLRAMSNLYFTTQYAPNSYNHEKESMQRETDARIEKAKAERERDRDAYLRYAVALGKAEGDRAKTLRELEAEQERRKMAAERAARDAELHPITIAIKNEQARKEGHLADKAESDAKISEENAALAPEMAAEKLRSQQALTKQREASASESRERAGSYKKKVHHFMGKEYDSEKDYEKDVTEAALSYNRRHMIEVNDERTGKKKMVYEEGFEPIVIEDRVGAYGDRKRRRPEEYAGEVERRLEQERAVEYTPPSRRNNSNDNTPPSRRK